jgi:tol-pal system protein YbgF
VIRRAVRPGLVAALAAAVSLGGCAMKSDVARVQNDVAVLREESARQDSARARQLGEIIRMQQQLFDSLATTRETIRTLRGDVANDLYGVQQQLVQLQELTGQSQRRLTELRTQLEARAEQLATTTSPGAAAGTPGSPSRADSSGAPAAAPAAGSASADQMYEASLGQLRRGSASTARLGFRELLRSYPQSDKVPDALYFIGESFRTENADSAGAYYDMVARSYPQSTRAPSALYNLGLLNERASKNAAARDAYQRVVQSYPKSDEAALARDRLKALGR